MSSANHIKRQLSLLPYQEMKGLGSEVCAALSGTAQDAEAIADVLSSMATDMSEYEAKENEILSRVFNRKRTVTITCTEDNEGTVWIVECTTMGVGTVQARRLKDGMLEIVDRLVAFQCLRD